MALKEYKKIVLNRLHDELKARGFKKAGQIFRKTTDDLIYFISLQSSQQSTVKTLKMTVNLEIASMQIARAEDTSLPMRHGRHWTARIGSLLDKPFDKWCTISDEQEAGAASQEIIQIIERKVLPEFERLKTTEDLINLWKNDKCPGLTEKQRQEYLDLVNTLKQS